MKNNINQLFLKYTIYAFQWLAFALSAIVVVPLVVGISLELNPQQISSFMQRTLFFTGLFSFIQAKWGHRVLIIEGPGGMWYSLFIVLALFYPATGKEIHVLRSDLVLGLILTGIVYLVIVISGLYSRLKSIFTPLVNGTFLILMPLSLSTTIINGMLGQDGIIIEGLISGLIAIVTIMIISLRAKGFIQSISILCGIAAGWIAAVFFGLDSSIYIEHSYFSLPEPFPWGKPTYDFGVIFNCLVVGLLIISNHIASIHNMHKQMNLTSKDDSYNKGLIVTGFANICAAIWGLVGFIPFASTIGFLKLTKINWYYPFYLFSGLFVLISLFPLVGGFFASIPEQVGYAVLLVVLCQVMGMGLREYLRLSLNNSEIFVIGISIISGVGIMFLPHDTFQFLNPTLRIIFGNGLIMGLIICITLEKLLNNDI